MKRHLVHHELNAFLLHEVPARPRTHFPSIFFELISSEPSFRVIVILVQLYDGSQALTL